MKIKSLIPAFLISVIGYSQATITITPGDVAPLIENATGAPKTQSQNADYTVTLNDSYMRDSGSADRFRKYLNEVNDGGTTVATLPDLGAVDDVWRFGTATASDTHEIVPDTGVTFDWDGKTTEDAIRISGKGHLVYARKTSANNYFFYGDIIGYSLVTNLYAENDAAQPGASEANSVGSNWFSGGGDQSDTMASSTLQTQDGSYSIRATESTQDFSRIRHTGNYGIGTFDITLWMNPVSGNGARVQVVDGTSGNDTNLGTQTLTVGGGWQQVNLTITSTVSNWSIMCYGTWTSTGSAEWYVDNVTITQ